MDPRERYDQCGRHLVALVMALADAQGISEGLYHSAQSALAEGPESARWHRSKVLPLTTYGVPYLYLIRFHFIAHAVEVFYDEDDVEDPSLFTAAAETLEAGEALEAHEAVRRRRRDLKEIYPDRSESEIDALMGDYDGRTKFTESQRQAMEDKATEIREQLNFLYEQEMIRRENILREQGKEEQIRPRKRPLIPPPTQSSRAPKENE